VPPPAQATPARTTPGWAVAASPSAVPTTTGSSTVAGTLRVVDEDTGQPFTGQVGIYHTHPVTGEITGLAAVVDVADGVGSVSLPPGRYAAAPLGDSGEMLAQPTYFTVSPGESFDVAVGYSSSSQPAGIFAAAAAGTPSSISETLAPAQESGTITVVDAATGAPFTGQAAIYRTHPVTGELLELITTVDVVNGVASLSLPPGHYAAVAINEDGLAASPQHFTVEAGAPFHVEIAYTPAAQPTRARNPQDRTEIASLPSGRPR
jgi:hypothetical protein